MNTQDERTMAMIAHGSALLNVVTGFGGVIAALVIYLLHKDKSQWVAFQSLQSLVYQVIVIAGFWILTAISIVLSFILIGCLFLPITVLLGFAAIAYSMYAAYSAYTGVDFRYIFIGDWLAAQQPPQPPIA